ncbi:MAG: protein kinase domain-containing protein [Christensenellales bacterium]
MEAYGLSDIGKYREENQDRYLIDGALGLYAVADGMGGLPGGAAAASTALHILAERMVGFFVDPRDRSRSFVYDYIKKTLQTLNAEVASEMGGAGTTLVILLTVGERAFFANAGDSPGFLYRDGRLTKMTRDHNVAGMEEGVPQISDLGIGRILRTNEMASTTTGTIYYMAPEVLHTDYEGAHATFNADIWSVGVTL